MPIEGRWAGNVVGLDDMRSEIAMMRIPDAPGRLELAKYHTPKAITPRPEITPAKCGRSGCLAPTNGRRSRGLRPDPILWSELWAATCGCCRLGWRKWSQLKNTGRQGR